MITYIRDANGRVKYTIRKVDSNNKHVYDKNGALLGSVRNGATYGKNGNLVSHDEDISALMG